MAGEGTFPKSAGDIAYASEANLFKKNSIQVYTGTGYDSDSDSSATDEQSYELTAISSANLTGADYLKIQVIAYCESQGDSAGVASPELKIQTKYVGGAYADSLTYTTLLYILKSTEGVRSKVIINYTYYHTLTQDEKDNGCQVKMFSKSNYTNPANSAFTNKQTIIYPI